MQLKKLLKEWKTKLYEAADIERLQKLAQLGDEEAAAELERQNQRYGDADLDEEARVDRLVRNLGLELLSLNFKEVPTRNWGPDGNRIVERVVEILAKKNDEENVSFKLVSRNPWTYFVSSILHKKQSYDSWIKSSMVSKNLSANNWMAAFEQLIDLTAEKTFGLSTEPLMEAKGAPESAMEMSDLRSWRRTDASSGGRALRTSQSDTWSVTTWFVKAPTRGYLIRVLRRWMPEEVEKLSVDDELEWRANARAQVQATGEVPSKPRTTDIPKRVLIRVTLESTPRSNVELVASSFGSGGRTDTEVLKTEEFVLNYTKQTMGELRTQYERVANEFAKEASELAFENPNLREHKRGRFKMRFKNLLKEWKAQIYETADLERLRRLAQLGDEEAQAELDRQEFRRSDMANFPEYFRTDLPGALATHPEESREYILSLIDQYFPDRLEDPIEWKYAGIHGRRDAARYPDEKALHVRFMVPWGGNGARGITFEQDPEEVGTPERQVELGSNWSVWGPRLNNGTVELKRENPDAGLEDLMQWARMAYDDTYKQYGDAERREAEAMARWAAQQAEAERKARVAAFQKKQKSGKVKDPWNF